jgi:DNA (cytosine-5)-methyltransferase 1
VFVVGCLGDWKPAAEVLFEPESLSGNTKPSRTQRESVTGYVESSFGQYREDVIAGTTKASGGVLGGGSETFIAYEWHNQDSRIKPVEIAATLNCNAGGREGHLVQNITSIQGNLIGRDKGKPQGVGVSEGETMYTLTKADVHGVAYDMKQHHNPQVTTNIQLTTGNCSTVRGDTPLVRKSMAVRRLSPVECERLQGFPDNYTNIKDKCPDGGRYKALGNSMAVPVMRWIGERINQQT